MNTYKTIKTHKIIMIDIDDTLVMWDLSKYKKLDRIEVNHNGKTILAINRKNCNLLIKLSKLGYTIIAWSHSGWDWAELICKSLGIDCYISLYLSKPRYYLDDQSSDLWMGEKLWRDPLS